MGQMGEAAKSYESESEVGVESCAGSQYQIGWPTVTAIFADVVVSPWNLLVGGLLTTKLSFSGALISILFGYAALSLFFYFYGGLGFSQRKTTSHLIEPVFGVHGTRMFFSAVLALGQIGWFAIISQIAGESLGYLLGIPSLAGITLFAFSMAGVASLKLQHHSLLKYVIVASSLGLIAFLVYSRSQYLAQIDLSFSNLSGSDIAWGISIIFSSLVSFLSVSPDFFAEVKAKTDISKSILYGLFLPGVLTTALGAAFFAGMDQLSIVSLLGVSSIAVIGHICNVLTNTDASIAIYTPGHRLSYMFKIGSRAGILYSAIFGLVLASASIADKLEVWLSSLAALFPSIIGVTIAWYSLNYFGLKYSSTPKSVEWRAILTIATCALLVFSVQIVLLPWLVALMSFLLFILMTGVTINIYIGTPPDNS